jgi:hypothetical protein
MSSVVVRKIVGTSLEKNLMWTDAVGLKYVGESLVVIVESHLVPVLVVMKRAESVMKAWGAGTAARRARSTARRICPRGDATAKAAVGACLSVACVGESKSTRDTRAREQDDCILHLVKCERVSVVNVGEKLIVCPLVAGGFREVDAHESDEGVDVRYRLYSHRLHLVELRSRGVDGGDVFGSSSRGVILETEARPEATGKDLVRDRKHR